MALYNKKKAEGLLKDEERKKRDNPVGDYEKPGNNPEEKDQTDGKNGDNKKDKKQEGQKSQQGNNNQQGGSKNGEEKNQDKNEIKC
jgi:hypothetical protein